jgi:MSHA biogenesis protein MshM
MYLEHFGLSEPPFRITPHTDFFFSGASRGATLDALIYAITHEEGIVKVSGEVGSGKTMLCRVVMERLPDTVTIIYLANPSLSPDDILYAIADELQLPVPENARLASVLRLLHEHLINSYAEGRQVVVLIDEAHAMPAETLEEIRLLSNLESNRSKLLQLVLFGQPELNAVLARPDMRQLKERITHNFTLEPLVREDIASYIDFRMRAAGYKGPSVFSVEAIKAITAASQGLTRRVNILADKALLAAFSDGKHQINTPQTEAAIRDCDFSDITTHPRKSLSKQSVMIILGIATVAAGLYAAYEFGLSRASSNEAKTANPASLGLATQPANVALVPPSAAQNMEANIAAPTSVSRSPSASSASQPAHVGNSQEPMQGTTPEENPRTVEKVTSLPEGAGKITSDYLNSSRAWLDQANIDRWFIQLFSTELDNAVLFERFLESTTKSGIDLMRLRVYLAARDGKPHLGAIYGDFPDRVSALAEIENLPKQLKANRPYPRQVKRLR